MVRLLSNKCELCARKFLNKYRLNKTKYSYSTTTIQNNDFAAGYVPHVVEKDKYQIWVKNLNKNSFDSSNSSFSMIMPPPNITGTLHLGHALTLTIQDVLMRWKRMNGISCMWVPGLDHAGIATQVVVEKKLWQENRQTRYDIGRDAFVDQVHLWKQEKSSQIREQIKQLGALPNWDKEYFTMDKQQANAVNEAFIRLFDDGSIYRSDYLVNWSCILRSAISDIEVEHLTVEGRTKLNIPGYEAPIEFGVLTKFAYKVSDGEEDEIIVSTTRPETILGDVAIAVHPDDSRYSSFRNKFVKHPFRDETIPIIFDEFVDPDFGTGAVKITPAHDPTDFTVGQKYKLPMRQVIDEKGLIIDDKEFSGLKRFHARNIILKKLGERGLLRSMEDHSMSIPLCSRSRDVVEHLVKPQWFLNCSDIAAKAAQDVREGRLTIEPTLFEKTWFNWLENIRDWCISRQLWWGHRIPAFYCTHPSLLDSSGKSGKSGKSGTWVAATDSNSAKTKAALKFNLKNADDINAIKTVQDDDVLDTWFSSALLPFSVFGWPQPQQKTLKYYPNDLLETGHDILFFWVARMVMLGHALTGQIPFKKVLLHGVICDSHGRKMSKSLGNVIAPEQIINGATLQELKAQTQASHNAGLLSVSELDKAVVGQQNMFPDGIPQCGADALRFTLLSHNIQSHFINFDINECYTNKLFCNKIWQSLKYTNLSLNRLNEYSRNNNKMVIDDLSLMDRWILSRLSCMVQDVNNSLQHHQFHNATNALKQFLYSEFCDVYVETTKDAFKKLHKHTKSSVAEGHVQVLVECLDVALRTLAPFMPHLSDELYKYLPFSSFTLLQKYETATLAPFPKNLDFNYDDAKLEEQVQIALDTVTVIRRLKKLANITGKTFPKVYIVTTASSSTSIFSEFADIIANLSKCSEIIPTPTLENDSNTISDTVGSYGIVHVLKDKTKDAVPNKYLAKKIEKLEKVINKLHGTMSADGYRNKAPENVQIQQKQKLANLREELHRLQNLQQ